MRLKVLWPGKTKNKAIKDLEDYYLHRINQLETCEIIATKEARGIPEREADRIQELEAQGLEKQIKDGVLNPDDKISILNVLDWIESAALAAVPR